MYIYLILASVYRSEFHVKNKQTTLTISIYICGYVYVYNSHFGSNKFEYVCII